MENAMPYVEAGSASIPALGIGTWPLTEQHCTDIVAAALQAGYRHVDTAEMYGNEKAVGAGLRASGVPRDQVFVTSKVWHDHLVDGELLSAARRSLDRLQTGHIDLYLIHWPSPDVPVEAAIAALNSVADAGIARAIGVSNFPVDLLVRAIGASRWPLAVNQVEYHPYLDQSKLLAAVRRNGMALTAYAPLGKGRVADDPIIVEIADKHDRTPAQVVLRWLIQQDGVIAIPKTGTPERLVENLGAISFALTSEEMARIHALAQPNGRAVNPSFAPDWDT